MNFDPKNRQHLLMAVTVAAVALFLGEKILITPLWNSWKARSERIAQLKVKVRSGETLLQRGESLTDRWGEMKLNALPAESSLAEARMSGGFQRWTQSGGVSMTSYRPQWKRAGDDFMTLECRADISGSMADIARFLYEIEHDPLGVKVDSADIATRDTDGAHITLALQVSGLQLISNKR